MLEEAKQLVAEHFPFLERVVIDAFMDICDKNGRLFYFPNTKQLLGYYRFYPELIYTVKEQDFDILEQCDLSEGPLIYVAVLIAPTDGFRTMWRIADCLEARAFAFHRYRHGEWSFHFFRNSRYGRGAKPNHASLH